MTKTKPLGVPDYLASPERAVALLNTVIACGGNLKQIRQALAIVTGALGGRDWVRRRWRGRLSQWKHYGAKAKRT